MNLLMRLTANGWQGKVGFDGFEDRHILSRRELVLSFFGNDLTLFGESLEIFFWQTIISKSF